jgi:hypothetical protein
MEVKEIIQNLNRPVVHNGSVYTLTGSTIRKDKNGHIYYTAELLDKNKNSICIVKLEGVELWCENTSANTATKRL